MCDPLILALRLQKDCSSVETCLWGRIQSSGFSIHMFISSLHISHSTCCARPCCAAESDFSRSKLPFLSVVFESHKACYLVALCQKVKASHVHHVQERQVNDTYPLTRFSTILHPTIHPRIRLRSDQIPVLELRRTLSCQRQYSRRKQTSNLVASIVFDLTVALRSHSFSL